MMQWKSITPNFSNSNTSMRNASSSIAQAANTFDGINRLRIAQEQQDVENARAEKAFNLQEQEFGMKQDAYARDVQGQQEAGTYLDIYSREGEAGLDAFLAQNGNPQTSAGNDAIAKIMGWDIQNQQLAQQQANADRTYNLDLAKFKASQVKTGDTQYATLYQAKTPKEFNEMVAQIPNVDPSKVKSAYDTVFKDDGSGSGGSGTGFASTSKLNSGDIVENIITKIKPRVGNDVEFSGQDYTDLTNIAQGAEKVAATMFTNGVTLSNDEIATVLSDVLHKQDQLNTFNFFAYDTLDDDVAPFANLLQEGEGKLARALYDKALIKNGGSLENIHPMMILKHGTKEQIDSFISMQDNPTEFRKFYETSIKPSSIPREEQIKKEEQGRDVLADIAKSVGDTNRAIGQIPNRVGNLLDDILN